MAGELMPERHINRPDGLSDTGHQVCLSKSDAAWNTVYQIDVQRNRSNQITSQARVIKNDAQSELQCLADRRRLRAILTASPTFASQRARSSSGHERA
jgi:hypothetical protein